MDKVKLPKDVVDAIEKMRAGGSSDYGIIMATQDKSEFPEREIIRSWSFGPHNAEDLLRALVIGYEVEQPKFEVGDWVVLEKTNTIKRVESINGNGISACLNGGCVLTHKDNFRHATKEEIFWAELGREVGKFKDGDVVQTKSMVSPYRLRSVQDLMDAKVEYLERNFKGFYPAESFKSFPRMMTHDVNFQRL